MPTNSLPYEVLGMPAEVYIADVGTAFPDIDAAPGASWSLLGTAGNLNYTQDGVKVSNSQSTSIFRALGDAGPRKVFRTEEDLKIALEIADMTLEQYKQAMNGNDITAVTSTPGTADYKKIGLSRGLTIATSALLIRIPGGSPYMADGNAQYEIPQAQQIGSAEPAFRRDGPALLAFEWLALVDPNAASSDERFGRFVAQTGASGS